MRARIYAVRKEHAKAVDDLTASLVIEPNNISNYVTRGQSLEALGRTDEAVTSYKATGALKSVTPRDILSQAAARIRLRALTSGKVPTCPNGPGCL